MMPPKEIVIVIVRHPVNGQLFVHQRSATKKTFPLFYGIGAGGHREVGETIEAGAARELREETGLETSIEYLFTTETMAEGRPQLDYVFETVADISHLPAHDEWCWFGWMGREELDALLQEGRLCTDTSENWRRYRQMALA